MGAYSLLSFFQKNKLCVSGTSQNSFIYLKISYIRHHEGFEFLELKGTVHQMASMSGFPQLQPNQPNPRPAPRHLRFFWGWLPQSASMGFFMGVRSTFFMEAEKTPEDGWGFFRIFLIGFRIPWCFSGNFLKHFFISGFCVCFTTKTSLSQLGIFAAIK